jgi:hypothetical protein
MSIKPVFYGVTTLPEVQIMTDAYQELREGDEILYADIAEKICEQVRSHRYMTIVTSWRKKLFKNQNIILIPDDGKKYIVASPHQRVTVSANKAKIGMRHISRSSIIAATTDRSRLSPEDAKTCDHYRMLPGKLRLAEMTAPKIMD